MLAITEEQLQALSEAQTRRVESDLVAHLRRNFQSELRRIEMADEDVPALVQQALADAETFVIRLRADRQLFVECAAILGPKFHDGEAHPRAREILTKPYWSATARMSALEAYLLFEYRPRA